MIHALRHLTSSHEYRIKGWRCYKEIQSLKRFMKDLQFVVFTKEQLNRTDLSAAKQPHFDYYCWCIKAICHLQDVLQHDKVTGTATLLYKDKDKYYWGWLVYSALANNRYGAICKHCGYLWFCFATSYIYWGSLAIRKRNTMIALPPLWK